MKTAQLIHNATAGNGDHCKEDLIALIKKQGYTVKYYSTDEANWKDFIKHKTDIICVAGGDGTVRKVADIVLQSKGKAVPIYLFPMGTANNIARTLEISSEHFGLEKKLKAEAAPFDSAIIHGIPEENFFIEGLGVGIFPELMYQMKHNRIEDESPEDKLQRTRQVLIDLLADFKAHKVIIEGENIQIEDQFLMVELMNIKYAGPNLQLAPRAKAGDGYLDLVLVREEKRSLLIDYVTQIIKGQEQVQKLDEFAEFIKVKKIKMSSELAKLHVDDILIDDYSGYEINITINSASLSIF
tara:strand:- start:77709 stop:78602 length:894 start_codon:yes stop_codon:yes gene_type:complete